MYLASIIIRLHEKSFILTVKFALSKFGSCSIICYYHTLKVT